jgi:Flp pilus assembly protein TadG
MQQPRKILLLRNQKGQGLVEFALISVILFLLLFAIIDFGWIMFNYTQTYNGFREATRYGSVNGGTTPQYKNCAGIRQRISLYAGYAGINTATVTIYYDDGRAISGTVASNPPELVGTCPSGGAYTANNSYLAEDGSTRVNPVQVSNGDRLVITANVSLKFLTPFMKAFAPDGFPLEVIIARSIFPFGLE